MEKIQERALRILYNDFSTSYESLLKMSEETTLHIKRLRLIALFVFKSLHEMGPSYLNSMFTTRESPYAMRNRNTLIQPKCNSVTYGLRSLNYLGPRLWNCLPNSIKAIDDYNMLKRIISTWKGPEDFNVYTHYV